MPTSKATNEPERIYPDLDYPALVASWVGDTIPDLEAGIFNGALAELIERPDVQEVLGPTLTERYQTIASEKLKHDPVFRKNWTQRFVAIFQDFLRPARKLFPARAAVIPKQTQAWSVNDGKPPSIAVSHFHGEVTLRPDQVLSARRWGNWFSFKDEKLDRYYTDFLVNQARENLASNIKNLWNIEATYLSGFSNLSSEATWHPELRGGLFEHLMLDVLNETAVNATHAPLAEDILERTDLWVQFPAVQQNPEARVQVALTANPELHERKLTALYVPDEFVILTPLALAMCAVKPPATPSFTMLTQQGFWAPLGGRCSDEPQLAHRLHELFLETFALSTTHPLGPMWILPPPLREFIRAFTEYHATQAVKCVRERLLKHGRKLDSVGKFTGPYWKAKFTQPPPKDELPKTKAIIASKPPLPKPPPNAKKASKVKPTSPEPAKIEKVVIQTPSPIASPIPLAGWKVVVHYYKNGKAHLKKLGRTPAEHGDPTDWTIPGPIHSWLKEQLVEAKISFTGIQCFMVEQNGRVDQADQLLEHLPLTKAEIDSCS